MEDQEGPKVQEKHQWSLVEAFFPTTAGMLQRCPNCLSCSASLGRTAINLSRPLHFISIGRRLWFSATHKNCSPFPANNRLSSGSSQWTNQSMARKLFIRWDVLTWIYLTWPQRLHDEIINRLDWLDCQQFRYFAIRKTTLGIHHSWEEKVVNSFSTRNSPNRVWLLCIVSDLLLASLSIIKFSTGFCVCGGQPPSPSSQKHLGGDTVASTPYLQVSSSLVARGSGNVWRLSF